MPMPDYALKEMLADWMGAGAAVKGSPVWKWYDENSFKIKLHDDTRSNVEQWLNWLELMNENKKAEWDKVLKGSKR